LISWLNLIPKHSSALTQERASVPNAFADASFLDAIPQRQLHVLFKLVPDAEDLGIIALDSNVENAPDSERLELLDVLLRCDLWTEV
jgi:hypothetical protein